MDTALPTARDRALTREEQLELIRDRVDKTLSWDSPDEALVLSINSAMIPNPDPQPTKRRVVQAKDMLALVSLESRKQVLEFPSLGLVKKAIEDQDEEAILVWVGALLTVERITEEEAQACYKWIMTPIPDPDWPELVPWPVAYLGSFVGIDDVYDARRLPRMRAMSELREAFGPATNAAYALIDPGYILPEEPPTREQIVAAFAASLGVTIWT